MAANGVRRASNHRCLLLADAAQMQMWLTTGDKTFDANAFRVIADSKVPLEQRVSQQYFQLYIINQQQYFVMYVFKFKCTAGANEILARSPTTPLS